MNRKSSRGAKKDAIDWLEPLSSHASKRSPPFFLPFRSGVPTANPKMFAHAACSSRTNEKRTLSADRAPSDHPVLALPHHHADVPPVYARHVRPVNAVCCGHSVVEGRHQRVSRFLGRRGHVDRRDVLALDTVSLREERIKRRGRRRPSKRKCGVYIQAKKRGQRDTRTWRLFRGFCAFADKTCGGSFVKASGVVT